MKYAIKVPVDDGWLYVTEPDLDGNPVVMTYDTFEEAELVNFNVWGGSGKGKVVEYNEDPTDKLTQEEIKELRAKKQAIKEELYEKVNVEMFKASSALEGIDYEEPNMPDMTIKRFKEICLAFEELREIEKKQRNKKKYKW